MIMTVEEAKKKWCPLFSIMKDSHTYCEASDCMMWKAVRMGDVMEGCCSLAGREA